VKSSLAETLTREVIMDFTSAGHPSPEITG
jgi:hypothetical protein